MEMREQIDGEWEQCYGCQLAKKKLWAKKREIDMNDVARLHLIKRGTIRSTTSALSIAKSNLYRNFQLPYAEIGASL